LEAIFFYIFAAASLAGALLVISHKNPVASALSLVLTLFSTAVLFVFLLAHFIAAIQILVYAGAIMVLFLFTVMFLNLREESLRFDAQNMPYKLGVLVVILLVFGYLARVGFKKGLFLINANTSLPQNFGTVEGVGEVLFRDYLLPFELTSVLIVVAILGVVVIAKRRLD
jgi:NADH-quinone oxidoreductase subunit J